MHCWNCGIVLDRTYQEKISFRYACDSCHADLHCCKNCKFYSVGRPNDCMIPGTDFVADRSKNNLCEEFSASGTFRSDTSKEDAKKRFDDLFK